MAIEGYATRACQDPRTITNSRLAAACAWGQGRVDEMKSQIHKYFLISIAQSELRTLDCGIVNRES